jgi:uncharacterized membrane protein YfcA
MDLQMSFPVSGVTTWMFLPPLVAFVVSFFASMGGVSGAFLLLPFQISYLHFVTPSVSATNFVYNIVAIPSGVYRYIREGRMAWHLAWLLVLATLPGIFLGYYLRVLYLPDPRSFRLFVACVLLYVGIRLALDTMTKDKNGGSIGQNGIFKMKPVIGIPVNLQTISFSAKKTEYEFCGNRFSFATPKMLIMAFLVGIVGGAYGIGGGSIIAPFCVAFLGLPVYMVAGAALFGTFLTSIAGVLFYAFVPLRPGISTSPDWLLGILFGVGGMLGMYCGARLQKHMPQKFIRMMLGVMLLFLAASYIKQLFAG